MIRKIIKKMGEPIRNYKNLDSILVIHSSHCTEIINPNSMRVIC